MRWWKLLKISNNLLASVPSTQENTLHRVICSPPTFGLPAFFGELFLTFQIYRVSAIR